MNYEILSTPVPMEFPKEWYDIGGDDHFWLIWRLQVLRRLLYDHSISVEQPFHALELGCGRAILRAQVEKLTRWVVDGADINEIAVREAIRGRGRTFLYDINDRRPEFREHYDVLMLFDVLEHIRGVDDFFADACWHLKPGGWILINVPALMGLYSRYDKAAGHVLRYDKRLMRDFFQHHSPQVEMIDIRYWGISLIMLVLVRKAVLHFVAQENIIETGFKPPTGWLNVGLRALGLIEAELLVHPPLGTSLMVLARKRP
jgi:SAM-dependent methyltransferase